MKLYDLYIAMNDLSNFDIVSQYDFYALKMLLIPSRMEKLKDELAWDDKKNMPYCQAALPYFNRGSDDPQYGYFNSWDAVVRMVSFRLFPGEEIEDPVIRSHRLDFSPQNNALLAQVASRIAKENNVTYRPYAPPKMKDTFGIVDLTKDSGYSQFRCGFSKIDEFARYQLAVNQATKYMENILRMERQRLYELGG